MQTSNSGFHKRDVTILKSEVGYWGLYLEPQTLMSGLLGPCCELYEFGPLQAMALTQVLRMWERFQSSVLVNIAQKPKKHHAHRPRTERSETTTLCSFQKLQQVSFDDTEDSDSRELNDLHCLAGLCSSTSFVLYVDLGPNHPRECESIKTIQHLGLDAVRLYKILESFYCSLPRQVSVWRLGGVVEKLARDIETGNEHFDV